MARGAMEDGHWIAPFVYGERFAERPVLLAWITALFGEMTGGVTLWSLRLPHLAFFLAGALMIYSLLRSNTGKSAAIFGALCWISMPLVAPKFINAEADIVLATLLFGAFCVWWQAACSKNITWLTWICIGILLGLAGLTKGPQPVAYFTLGVGAYVILKQRDQILGFIVANMLSGAMVAGWYLLVYEKPSDVDYWAVHSRLLTTTGLDLVRDHLDFVKSIAVEMLPATILLGPAMVIVLRQWRTGKHDLMLAATLYALECTLVLVLWPGGVAARYAMPATMALAVICGLMFEHCRLTQPRLIASALVVTYLIFGGLLARGWIAMPFWPHLFKGSEIAGNEIASVVRESPGPLYVIGTSTEHNMLVYVPGKIRAVTLDYLAKLNTAAIAVMLPEEERALSQLNPGIKTTDLAEIGPQKSRYRIVRIEFAGAR